MAKDRRKLQHIHSSVFDKQPTPATLELGEIGVNNHEDGAFLSIKNTKDDVVRFSEDKTMVDWMELKEVIPYKGYVRGETGTNSTTGDTPTADRYGSYGITEKDLLNNTSNIVVKMNQVSAKLTPYYDKVNGAKDRYNKEINPISADGNKNGGGYFIDMSRYAMQGANPSFSSVTTTCHATFYGTTEIIGANLDGNGNASDGGEFGDNNSCGSELNIKVSSAITSASTANTKITDNTVLIGTNSSTISGNTTEKVSGTTTVEHKGNVTETNLADKGVFTSGNTTADTNGNVVVTTSGTTTETKKLGVTENNQSTYTQNTTGVTTIDRHDNVSVNNRKDVTITTSGNTTHTINVNSVTNVSGTTTENKRGNVTENTTGTTTIVRDGNVKETNLHNRELYVSGSTTADTNGNVTVTTSGATTETKKGAVTENNQNNYTVNTTGNVSTNTTGTTTENKIGDVTENTTGTTTIDRHGNVSENNRSDVTIVTSGNTTHTIIGNSTTNVSGDTTVDLGSDVNVTISGNTDIDQEGDLHVNNQKNVTIVTSGNTTHTISGNSITRVSGNTTADTNGNVVVTTSGTTTETKKGNVTENTSGTTTIKRDGNVTVTDLHNNTHNITGNEVKNVTGSSNTTVTNGTTFTSCKDYTLYSDDIVLSSCTETNGSIGFYTKDMCLSASNATKLYGAQETNVGRSCDNDNTPSVLTSVAGVTLKTSATTANTNIVNDTTVIGMETRTVSGNSTTRVSGTSSNMYAGNVTNRFEANKTEHITGNVTTNVTGSVETVIAQSANTTATTTNYQSCGGLHVTSDDITIEGCTTAGTMELKSCDGVSIRSKNITITDEGCSSEGEITVETNDLCLVGETKVNVYGTTTNVGIDCYAAGNTVATNTNVKGVTTNISGTTTHVTGLTTLNLSGTTMNVNGTTLNITETNTNITGTNLTIKENATSIESPSITVSGSSLDVKDCTKISAQTDNMTIEQCGNEGSITIKEKTATISGTNLNITEGATTINSNNTNITGSSLNIVENSVNVNTDIGKICLTSDIETDIYGGNVTKLGVSCDDEVSSSVIVRGTTVNVSGDTSARMNAPTVTMSGSTVNVSGTTVGLSGATVNVRATTLCHSGNTVTMVAGAGGLYIGGQNCTTSGGTYPIVYERRADSDACGVKSKTIDDALHEIMNRRKIHINKEDLPASDENLYKITIWQDGTAAGATSDDCKESVEFFVPKDHLLKTTEIVNGVYNSSTKTFTDCSSYTGNKNDCHWYIKFIWNVHNPDNNHSNDKVDYLDANTLVEDLVENNSATTRGAYVHVWYDGQKKYISADTTVRVVHNGSTTDYTKSSGVNTVTAYTTTLQSGSVQTFSSSTFDPFGAAKTFNVPTDASHINRNTLSVSYGSTSSAPTQTYDPGNGTVNGTRSSSITVPSCVSHLNRGTLKVEYGTSTGKTDLTYDPGAGCTNEPTSTIYIPTSTAHISKQGLSWTYGAITGSSDSYDTTAAKSFQIPTCVSHLGRSILAVNYGSNSDAINTTYDPGRDNCNGGTSTTITIPKSLSHLTDWTADCLNVGNSLCVTGKVSANSFFQSSDKNLKENIKPLTAEDITKASRVEFKTFNFKDDEDKRKTYGVIAQDVLEAGLDQVVNKDEKGELSVDYISMLILKIASLENTIKNLSGELNILKSKMN